MKVNQYDTVILKDGREAVIVEAFDGEAFIADVGTNEKDWETIAIKAEDIEKVVK